MSRIRCQGLVGTWSLAALLVVSVHAHGGDVVRVRLDPAVRPASEAGRLIVFFIREGARPFRGEDPLDGPFFTDPQPIVSVPVGSFKPGDAVDLDDRALAYPAPLSELDGTFRVQAVFKCNPDERSHAAPGNPYSEATTITLDPAKDDTVELDLSKIFVPPPLPEHPQVAWIDLPSPMLTSATGREVHHRAGVVFPPGYHDIDHPRRMWPTIYVVPGFGGRYTDAMNYLRMMLTPRIEEVAPQAVFVVLDPESPLGHHGFVDSPNHGPRGTALVKELIPYLESRYRLVPSPEARIVTGHSSGGWASLWLQLQWPDVFGACWSSAPDPVDFSAFQMSDLYRDQSVMVDAEGNDVPSYRWPVSPELDKVLMTVRQELGMERVLGPDGDSGEQWDAWSAMFSSRDPERARPRPMCDFTTGAIDHQVIDHDWSRFDIARLVLGDWDRYGPIMRDHVRLACGERDSFYLQRAVIRLRDAIAARQAGKDAAAIAPGTAEAPKPDGDPTSRSGATDVPGRPAPAAPPASGADAPNASGHEPADASVEPPAELRIMGGPGYIWLVKHASHETIVPMTTLRWNQEMIDYLRSHGLQ